MSLKDDFVESDIVLHEQIGWTQEGADAMDRVARGDDVAVHDDTKGINERKKELLKGTFVRNGFWDLPSGHLSTPEFSGFFGGLHNLSQDEWQSRFSEMVLRRDRLALRTIGKTIDRLGEDLSHPNILVIAGISHIALANCYKANFECTEVTTTYPNLEVNDEVSHTLQLINSHLTTNS